MSRSSPPPSQSLPSIFRLSSFSKEASKAYERYYKVHRSHEARGGGTQSEKLRRASISSKRC
jgi:hypothetical protein